MTFDTHTAGSIMFSSRVPRHTIVGFMRELRAANQEFDWIDLHMRDAAGRTLVSYRVDLKEVSEIFHDRFSSQVIGRLKTLLGEGRGGHPKRVDWWSIANLLEST